MLINRILVAGSIAYDEIMDFPGLFVDYFQPEKLHNINVSFVVDKLVKQYGGIATNISYNARLVTSKGVDVIGSVGKDGQAFVDFFTSHRINTSHIYKDAELYTASGKVMTDTKNNQIWAFYYGASACVSKSKLETYKDGNTLLVLSATHSKPFLYFQEQAIKHSIPYLYDPGMTLTWISPKDLEEGIYHAKYLVANDYEITKIQKILHVTVEELVANNVIVITTLGEDGTRYQSKDEELIVPAYKINKVIDPTGAGDAFRGGFIGSMAEEKTVIEALKTGNVLASFAIEKYGTVNHKPTSGEIKKRIDSLI
jgi:adenosine kinase